jgi:hypothetical protein
MTTDAAQDPDVLAELTEGERAWAALPLPGRIELLAELQARVAEHAAHRSLLNGELALSPKPPWFVTHRKAATTGRRLVEFAADPRWGRLPRIFASALCG